MHGEVSMATGLRRTALNPSIGRRQDRRPIGLPRRTTAAMAPLQTIAVRLRRIDPILLLTQRHAIQRRALRASLLHTRFRPRAHFQPHTTPAEEDIPASQAADTPVAADTPAEAADAGSGFSKHHSPSVSAGALLNLVIIP
jgi:hypothetical protein